MTSDDRKRHFFWSVVAVFIIQLPLLLYYATSPLGFMVLIGLFLLVALLVGAIYLALVRVLHADREAPIPWYASPIVWLGVPVFAIIIYALLSP